MDVFNLHNSLITDYSTYIRSFISIQDQRIEQRVQAELDGGSLWPDPLIQLNPNFESGAWIDDLTDRSILHPDCKQIFRIGKNEQDPLGTRMRLHKHQTDAIEAATSGDNYVLTTGTGSGKSLSYIVPIVNHVLRRGSGKGIQAIIVYPMNALANSQAGELEKFLGMGKNNKPLVTFRRYTGQESDVEKQAIRANPPDIILTNYVMLELILTRPHEHKLVEAATGLSFIVLDELHTYRGRQGADVAMLVRRLREATRSTQLQCVGTSATLSDGGTFEQQQEEVAAVASLIFGSDVKPKRVIGETLVQATVAQDMQDATYIAALTARVADSTKRPPLNYADFIEDPLSIWIESTFGLTAEAETERLIRATPISITGDAGAAKQLAALTGVSAERCEQVIRDGLMAGYAEGNLDPRTGFPVFAFRLHQFISRGDTVYASLEDPDSRYITLNGQTFVPGDRQKTLLPLAFCRECGQEYYVVTRVIDQGTTTPTFIPRELRDQRKEDDEDRGFLFRNPDNPWPLDEDEALHFLPEDWLEDGKKGLRVKRHNRKKRPHSVRVNTNGQEDMQGSTYHFVQSPFPFCLNCGVAYSGRTRSDFSKLASLSSEGRSTATTVLTLSSIQALRSDDALADKAKKLLSFTDNRQDAALQAGHFNDFIEVGLLRAAIYKAVDNAGADGLTYETLPQAVYKALALPIEYFAADPGVKFKAKSATEKALRSVIAYRVFQDLRRGWRVTAPNLEQCGLLKIEYQSLDELCQSEKDWQGCHTALVSASPNVRHTVARTLLDYLRRELAIETEYLEPVSQESIQRLSKQHLVEPWSIDEDEKMTHAAIAFPHSRSGKKNYEENIYVSPRSGFGQYLRRMPTFPDYNEKISLDETQTIIEQMFEMLRLAGLVKIVAEAEGDNGKPGYQVLADGMVWQAGSGEEPFYDPIRMPRQSSGRGNTNDFFVRFYKNVAATLQGIYAREHTAQVPSSIREQRETAFRKAELPVLYCSPTMELGVDISQLNVVNMRNVPPTPANYAQRSGRAGRSGQPALVFTYCTTGSPHDQYFFKQPERMVKGAVTPPRLDLTNEDLIRTHVQAVWLAETKQSLGQSLVDILDLENGLELVDSVLSNISAPRIQERTVNRVERILQTVAPQLQSAVWYTPDWIAKTVRHAAEQFDAACTRWRDLYRSARAQQNQQHEIILNPTSTVRDRRQAEQLRRQAENQLNLLMDSKSAMQSDFYSYRYFASEGFLPGYNFPRLPLSAFVPGRRKAHGQEDEFLSRSRFLAISEFGPRSIIYHEGSRYAINRVILPVSDDTVFTTSAKLCENCGYLHPITDISDGGDLCDHCGIELGLAKRSLFRMQNVATVRRERITSDEEERTRMGYKLRTGVRFAQYGNRPNQATSQIYSSNKEQLLNLTYGDTATIWRINLGWRRRKPDTPDGFMLDVERGYWQRNEQDVESDPEDPMSPRAERVIPFVEDRRNCLLIEFADRLDNQVVASLQPALKTAIQICYQLEDNELAVEPLPDLENRRMILIYESAEGGAGVLRQIVDDPHAIQKIARTALTVCHFDPDTGEDQHKAPRAKENCEAACYDCLMSYFNQMDHRILDRHLIRDILLALASGSAATSPSGTRAKHFEQLKAQCDSDLERDWLDLLEQHNLQLPDEAQKLIESCSTRPDFWYEGHKTAIYIDGPHHDESDIAAKDRDIEECLTFEAGIRYLRFHYLADWLTICEKHPHIFGDQT